VTNHFNFASILLSNSTLRRYIMARMEKTDAAIASLEREIEEAEDRGESDREQVGTGTLAKFLV
jgi:hypothetical protein